jgi:hypothetical protein
MTRIKSVDEDGRYEKRWEDEGKMNILEPVDVGREALGLRIGNICILVRIESSRQLKCND